METSLHQLASKLFERCGAHRVLVCTYAPSTHRIEITLDISLIPVIAEDAFRVPLQEDVTSLLGMSFERYWNWPRPALRTVKVLVRPGCYVDRRSTQRAFARNALLVNEVAGGLRRPFYCRVEGGASSVVVSNLSSGTKTLLANLCGRPPQWPYLSLPARTLLPGLVRGNTAGRSVQRVRTVRQPDGRDGLDIFASYIRSHQGFNLQRLDSSKWAAPDIRIGPAGPYLSESPVLLERRDGIFVCSCSIFKDSNVCVHGVFGNENLEFLECLPLPVSIDSVISIKDPMGTRTFGYYVDGCFVTPGSASLRCHTCGISDCAHVDAVATMAAMEDEGEDEIVDEIEEAPQNPCLQFPPSIAQHGTMLHLDRNGWAALERHTDTSAGDSNVFLPSPWGTRVLKISVDDALAVGLFSVGTNFVALRLLYDCLYAMVTDGCSIAGFVSKLDEQYAALASVEGDPAQRFITRSTFAKIFYRFLHVVTPEHSLICPICADEPKVLIGDGTACTIRASEYLGEDLGGSACVEEVRQRHRRVDRAFVNSSLGLERRMKLRRLLRKFAETVKHNGALEEGVEAELKALLLALNSEGVVSWVLRHYERTSDAGRRFLSLFLQCLASEAAVISYFPSTIVHVFDGDRVEAEALDAIRRIAPIIHGALVVDSPDGRSVAIPQELVGLLDQLKRRAGTCGSGPSVSEDYPQLVPASAGTQEYIRSGVCSGLAELRSRPNYSADRLNVEDVNCTHAFPTRGARTAGIFTWFCSHGVCYYFGIMRTAEGRDEPFSFLTRYLKRAPDIVVYDFACALQEYCLNRCPAFFKDTRFLVDKFHWPGHRDCPPSFNIGLYPSLSYVNSITAEQNNAALKRLRSSVSRMKQRPFMLLVHLFMLEWNRKKFVRLQQITQHVNQLNERQV